MVRLLLELNEDGATKDHQDDQGIQDGQCHLDQQAVEEVVER